MVDKFGDAVEDASGVSGIEGGSSRFASLIAGRTFVVWS